MNRSSYNSFFSIFKALNRENYHNILTAAETLFPSIWLFFFFYRSKEPLDRIVWKNNTVIHTIPTVFLFNSDESLLGRILFHRHRQSSITHQHTIAYSIYILKEMRLDDIRLSNIMQTWLKRTQRPGIWYRAWIILPNDR